jgi:hypothetical protein
MDKKLTDSEITIKALKELLEVMLSEGDLQRTSTISHTIDLITRLQEENKNLQERNVILSGLVDTQKAENDKLFADNQKYLSVMLWGNKKNVKNLLNQIKAEAYKEFWNELKKHSRKMQSSDFSGEFWDKAILVEDGDNLLKELVGE